MRRRRSKPSAGDRGGTVGTERSRRGRQYDTGVDGRCGGEQARAASASEQGC